MQRAVVWRKASRRFIRPKRFEPAHFAPYYSDGLGRYAAARYLDRCFIRPSETATPCRKPAPFALAATEFHHPSTFRRRAACMAAAQIRRTFGATAFHALGAAEACQRLSHGIGRRRHIDSSPAPRFAVCPDRCTRKS